MTDKIDFKAALYDFESSDQSILQEGNYETIQTALRLADRLQSEVNTEGDRAYCKYIDAVDKNCRGTDYKLENAKFTRDDLNNHTLAHEYLGIHQGLSRVIKMIKEMKGE